MSKHVYTGFDSAWSANNNGAVVSAIEENGTRRLVGPTVASFDVAAEHIEEVGEEAATHAIAIDQPLIVKNGDGQRPVETVVGSPIGRRRGGVCSSNLGEHNRASAANQRAMFGDGAPIWPFLATLNTAGFIHDPRVVDSAAAPVDRYYVEVYPALANLGLFPRYREARAIKGDQKQIASVPKYNPENRNNFSIDDWRRLCGEVRAMLATFGVDASAWLESAAAKERPRKRDQDQLDALIALGVILQWHERRPSCVIGGIASGYMVTPQVPSLCDELRRSADKIGVSFYAVPSEAE